MPGCRAIQRDQADVIVLCFLVFNNTYKISRFFFFSRNRVTTPLLNDPNFSKLKRKLNEPYPAVVVFLFSLPLSVDDMT